MYLILDDSYFVYPKSLFYLVSSGLFQHSRHFSLSTLPRAGHSRPPEEPVPNSRLLFSHPQMKVVFLKKKKTCIQFRLHSNPFFKPPAYTEGVHRLFLPKCETLYFSLLNWIIFISHTFFCLSIFVSKLVYTSRIFKTKKKKSYLFLLVLPKQNVPFQINTAGMTIVIWFCLSVKGEFFLFTKVSC